MNRKYFTSFFGPLLAVVVLAGSALAVDVSQRMNDPGGPNLPPGFNAAGGGTTLSHLFTGAGSSGPNGTCDTPIAAPTRANASGSTYKYYFYRFTAPQNGCTTVRVRNTGNGFGTVTVAAYAGDYDQAANPKTNLVGYIKDTSDSYYHPQFFSFRVTGGQMYSIAVISDTGNTDTAYELNINDSAAASSDFDGDGFADVAVYRPSTGTWFIVRSSDNTVMNDFFGTNGDNPVDGDFDGDGKTDIALFRSSNSGWYIKLSYSGKVIGAVFGSATDKITPGDYDHDGITDIAIYRPSTGQWFVSGSKNGFTDFFGFTFGANGDIPVGHK